MFCQKRGREGEGGVYGKGGGKRRVVVVFADVEL